MPAGYRIKEAAAAVAVCVLLNVFAVLVLYSAGALEWLERLP